MVAPSFQKYKVCGDPYIKGGKAYIDVQHPTTNNIRSVRWYDANEYAKIYGKKVYEESSKIYGGLKQARGFSQGPILLIRNYTGEEDENYLRQSPVTRYAVDVGWYLPSSEKIPDTAPPHFKFIPMTWEEFQAKRGKK